MAVSTKLLLSDILNVLRREIFSYKIKPIDTIAFLTYRCTSRCKTCNIWKRNTNPGSELDWSEWHYILEDLRNSGLKSFEIFGGDALLRKDIIFKIIQFCHKHDIETYFPTNSILVDRETAYKLVESGLHTIYISLDNIDTKNDEIRGVNDSFNKVKKALEIIIEAKEYFKSDTPQIIICTTISNLNYSDFNKIVNFLSHYPVQAIYPRIITEFPVEVVKKTKVMEISPSPYFVTTEEKSHFLTQKELYSLKKDLNHLIKNNSHPYINFQGILEAPDSAFINGSYGYRKCLVCSTVPVITPEGDVLPCPFFPEYKLGNLLKYSLKQIWGNSLHRHFIQSQRNHSIGICNYCIMPSFYPTLRNKFTYYQKKLIRKSRENTNEAF